MADEQPGSETERTRIPVVEERIEIGKRRTETGRVRVSRTSHQRESHIDEPLDYEDVEVTRVAVNQIVASPPPIRQEGETTIIPVLEEQLVVEKHLVLREEIHVSKRHRQERFVTDVPTQFDEVAVERDPTQEGGSPPQ